MGQVARAGEGVGVSKPPSPEQLVSLAELARLSWEELRTQDGVGESGVPEEGEGRQEGHSGPQGPGQSMWGPPGAVGP